MNNDIYVRDWMAQCIYVQEDYLRRNGVKKLEYGIYPFRTQNRYHENVLGELIADEIQEETFIFTAKMQYADGNASRFNFYQNIVAWIEEQNLRKNFPRFNNGIVQSVNANIQQYVSEPNIAEERNEVQIRFTYKRFNQ